MKDNTLVVVHVATNIRDLVSFLQSNTSYKVSLKWAKIDDEGVKELE